MLYDVTDTHFSLVLKEVYDTTTPREGCFCYLVTPDYTPSSIVRRALKLECSAAESRGPPSRLLTALYDNIVPFVYLSEYRGPCTMHVAPSWMTRVERRRLRSMRVPHGRETRAARLLDRYSASAHGPLEAPTQSATRAVCQRSNLATVVYGKF